MVVGEEATVYGRFMILLLVLYLPGLAAMFFLVVRYYRNHRMKQEYRRATRWVPPTHANISEPMWTLVHEHELSTTQPWCSMWQCQECGYTMTDDAAHTSGHCLAGCEFDLCSACMQTVRTYHPKVPEETSVLMNGQQRITLPSAQTIADVNESMQTDTATETFDGHLLIGVTLYALQSFLAACGWPERYTRSEEFKERNGPLVRGRETGYDLAKHIRTYMRLHGYHQYSVAELLRAAAFPGVAMAVAFISHAQSELAATTLRFLYEVQQRCFAGSSIVAVFLDYCCLRQCVPDFIEENVQSTIKQIGLTILCLEPTADRTSFVMMRRVWCCFEIFCTMSSGARIWAVSTNSLPWMLSCKVSSSLGRSVSLQEAEASDPGDHSKLIGYLETLPGGVHAANAAVSEALACVYQKKVSKDLALTTLNFFLSWLKAFGILCLESDQSKSRNVIPCCSRGTFMILVFIIMPGVIALVLVTFLDVGTLAGVVVLVGFVGVPAMCCCLSMCASRYWESYYAGGEHGIVVHRVAENLPKPSVCGVQAAEHEPHLEEAADVATI